MTLLCKIILDHVGFVTLGYMFEKDDLTALPFQEENTNSLEKEMIVSCRNSKQSRYNKALLGSETVKYLLTPFAIPDEMRSL